MGVGEPTDVDQKPGEVWRGPASTPHGFCNDTKPKTNMYNAHSRVGTYELLATVAFRAKVNRHIFASCCMSEGHRSLRHCCQRPQQHKQNKRTHIRARIFTSSKNSWLTRRSSIVDCIKTMRARSLLVFMRFLNKGAKSALMMISLGSCPSPSARKVDTALDTASPSTSQA